MIRAGVRLKRVAEYEVSTQASFDITANRSVSFNVESKTGDYTMGHDCGMHKAVDAAGTGLSSGSGAVAR